MFTLDTVLQQDTILLGSLPLCGLLLMNDSHYPWFILVPRVEGITELVSLSNQQTNTFWRESHLLSNILLNEFKVEKLNIAALGNVVSQLHIHHVGRFASDAAWPKPVWGAVNARPYSADEINIIDLQVKHAAANDSSMTVNWHR